VNAFQLGSGHFSEHGPFPGRSPIDHIQEPSAISEGHSTTVGQNRPPHGDPETRARPEPKSPGTRPSWRKSVIQGKPLLLAGNGRLGISSCSLLETGEWTPPDVPSRLGNCEYVLLGVFTVSGEASRFQGSSTISVPDCLLHRELSLLTQLADFRWESSISAKTRPLDGGMCRHVSAVAAASRNTRPFHHRFGPCPKSGHLLGRAGPSANSAFPADAAFREFRMLSEVGHFSDTRILGYSGVSGSLSQMRLSGGLRINVRGPAIS
jgi:hypothetical protein